MSAGKVTAGGLVHWFNEPWWEVHPSPLRGCSAWSPTAKSTCLTLKICCRRSTTRCAPCLPLARSPLTILSCTHSFVCTFIHLFVRSIIHSCVRSFARPSVYSFTWSIEKHKSPLRSGVHTLLSCSQYEVLLQQSVDRTSAWLSAHV